MKVSRTLIVALINCDDSGLDIHDKHLLNDLANDVGTATLDFKDETTFCKCSYSGLFDDCLDVEIC